MITILVRHGTYNTEDTNNDGGLSESGVRDIQLLREYLDAKKIIFDQAFTSPKTRALQTAEILCQDCTVVKELSPSSSARIAFDIIPKEGTILVVSHNPLIGELSELFGEHVSFEPGTMALYGEEGLEKVWAPT